MSAPLDELYLTWLYSQVGSVKLTTKTRTYWSLLRQLHSTEFVWQIRNDDNRVEDGRDLRLEFIAEEDESDPDPAWMDLGCSMLELLVVLSRELFFQVEGEPRDWFWHLIDNLGIRINDREYDRRAELAIDAACKAVIFRTYSSDGRGGLFPLHRPNDDQRDVEIWYQLNAYLLEML